MGVYYKFANFTKKEILDLDSLKLGEITRNSFDHQLITQYLAMNVYDKCEYKFISDESGEWDKCSDFKDITCDVLVDMFADGFEPSQWQFGWIYGKFKAENRLEELAVHIKGFKKKNK